MLSVPPQAEPGRLGSGGRQPLRACSPAAHAAGTAAAGTEPGSGAGPPHPAALGLDQPR